MKQYKTLTEGVVIRKIGRAKKVYFESNYCYFVWGGKRVRLDDVVSLSYPVMYEDENGKLGDIGGFIGVSNCYGVLVEVLDGEAVQLWEEVEN